MFGLRVIRLEMAGQLQLMMQSHCEEALRLLRFTQPSSSLVVSKPSVLYSRHIVGFYRQAEKIKRLVESESKNHCWWQAFFGKSYLRFEV